MTRRITGECLRGHPASERRTRKGGKTVCIVCARMSTKTAHLAAKLRPVPPDYNEGLEALQRDASPWDSKLPAWARLEAKRKLDELMGRA